MIDNFRRGVAALLVMLAFVCAVALNDHSIVNVHAKSVLYSFDIGAKTIGRNLRTIFQARGYVAKNALAVMWSRFPTLNEGTSLVSASIAQNVHTSPSVGSSSNEAVLFFLANESPNFVKLQEVTS